MFTGIIQASGRVLAREARGSECRFTFAPQFSLEDVIDGESIAVNGACLSVERHDTATFTAYASAETMRRTSLGFLEPGSVVNLERALRPGDRLGGHIVAGHVDCLARVESVSQAGQSVCVRLSFPAERACEVIEKGSVALDGISLTINACGRDWLTVNIIPDTQKRTTMGAWKPGHLVNMETDVLGKYVRRILTLHPGSVPAADTDTASTTAPAITKELLMEKGFFS